MLKFLKLFCIFSFLLFISEKSLGQTVLGTWYAPHDKKDKKGGLISVYQGKNGKYFAKVIDMFDPEERKKICSKCTDWRKNKPILGIVLITDLSLSADKRSGYGGKILDTRTGKIYKCKVWLEGNDVLKIRGYWGVFYGTRTWVRPS